MKPHIWIDADSCPRLVRDHVVRYAAGASLEVTFAANRPIRADGGFEMALCGRGKDSADDYIEARATTADLVITRDILFAARLVEKQITVINDRGGIFSKENIREKLEDREFDLQLAEAGLKSPRTSTYGRQQLARFAGCFDREIRRLRRQDALLRPDTESGRP